MAPRPESPSLLDDVQFSLCGNAIKLGNREDLDYMFQAQRIRNHEAEKHLHDPHLIVKIGSQYYNAKDAKHLLPELFNTITQSQFPSLVRRNQKQ